MRRTKKQMSIVWGLMFVVSCGDTPDVDAPNGDPPDVGDTTCSTQQDSESCEVFQIVNEERMSNNLTPYVWNNELAVAAQRHAQDMVERGYFSHDSLDGRNFSDRAIDAGYNASPTGENIAAGQRSATEVMRSWMNSSGHRANILSARSTELGVGFYDNYWVQVFGRR